VAAPHRQDNTTFCLERLSRAKQLTRLPRVFVDADAVQNISG